MDKATSKGMSADECAASILKSLLGNEKDVIISDLQAKVGFWLRFICPPLYFWIMEKRALSTVKEE